ncbi:MAG TPA: hypothetical protein VF031_01060 [Alphaproteobacteria bacterium]
MFFTRRDLSSRTMRWIRATLNLLIGMALVLLASAMFDHQNMEFDLTWAVAAAVGFYCILRGLVLFWVQ